MPVDAPVMRTAGEPFATARILSAAALLRDPGQAARQRVHPEGVRGRRSRGPVRGTVGRRADLEMAQRCDLLVRAQLVRRLAQRVDDAAGLAERIFERGLERAVTAQQFRCGLGTDAACSRYAVGGIAAQRD